MSNFSQIVMFFGGYMTYFLAYPSKPLQVMAAIGSALLGFSAIIAYKYVRRANQPSPNRPTGITDFIRAFKYSPNFFVCMSRFFTGSWEGTLAAVAIYYLTYVCKLSR